MSRCRERVQTLSNIYNGALLRKLLPAIHCYNGDKPYHGHIARVLIKNLVTLDKHILPRDFTEDFTRL